MRQFTRAVKLPSPELRGTARMAVLLLGVEVMVRLWSIRRVAHVLGVRLDDRRDDVRSSAALTDAEQRQLRHVRRVVRNLRFAEGTCLREALLSGFVLRHREPHLRFGLVDSGGRLVGHAWIEVDGIVIGRPALRLRGP